MTIVPFRKKKQQKYQKKTQTRTDRHTQILFHGHERASAETGA